MNTLQTFTLNDLAPYTSEGAFPSDADPYSRWFFVGRDDVHGVLKHLISRVTLSFKFNMFGYDDDELNQTIMGLIKEPTVVVQATLDKSQAGGVHEKKIVALDEADDPEGFANSFVIGQSATHQISHTKGGVLDNIVAFEGSTNWSASGEGQGIFDKNRKGFKAQNNTLVVTTHQYNIARFAAQLDAEHAIARAQQK